MLNRVRLVNQRANLIVYAKIKIDAEDWHAVADAMMDLREIDAKLEVWDALEKECPPNLKVSNG